MKGNHDDQPKPAELAGAQAKQTESFYDRYKEKTGIKEEKHRGRSQKKMLISHSPIRCACGEVTEIVAHCSARENLWGGIGQSKNTCKDIR